MARRNCATPSARGALALAAVLALAGACSDGIASTQVPDSAQFRVEKRDLKSSVSEKGALKPANQISIRPEIPGQAKIIWLVEEGSTVKEGDVICELDPTDKTKEVADLENRVIQLNGEVTAAEAELQIQLSQNEADIADASLKHHLAELELNRYQKGEFIQEKSKREVRVEEAKSDLERTTRKYEQMPDLLKLGFVTSEQVEEERIKKVKAESELMLAELDLTTYLTFAAPKELDQKQANLRNTELEMDRSKQRAITREAQKRAGVQRQKRELSNVQTSLEKAKDVLGKMKIKAPSSGLVIYGDTRNQKQREIKVGELVYSGESFLTLPDLSEMQVVVAIHEADISRLQVGQKAFVTLERASETSLEGEVLKIAPVTGNNNRRWNDESKRFDVEVALRGDIRALQLKPGLTARVEIQTGDKKGVLAVPVQAVFAQRGKFYVFTKRGSEAVRTEVCIEDGNSQYSIVKSGVSEGDVVLLYNAEATDASHGIPSSDAPPTATAGRAGGSDKGGASRP